MRGSRSFCTFRFRLPTSFPSCRGGTRPPHVEGFPVSIDFRAFSEQSESAAVVERAKQIKAKTHDIQIAVGVDRLDYTKGIPERLKAFGYFLRTYPEFHRRVELIQGVV